MNFKIEVEFPRLWSNLRVNKAHRSKKRLNKKGAFWVPPIVLFSTLLLVNPIIRQEPKIDHDDTSARDYN
jgi:hypothetical protein